ncbi:MULTISPECIES: SirB2 family protein [Photobacterium]|uniref:Invasion protein n=1 Tax=Photobacterium halotolerans TaxID=265726 RepID=A0A7X4WTL7_9GAMM|nr:SirB2 family protein [Photobacterium halotolerans]NAW66688.1 invasion protein [Photobacterium halotolerans]NAW88657.1 invasion protein [Photobacterium halotolerans]NAX49185.1 invasion protein [Photobacterium halotolerans]
MYIALKHFHLTIIAMSVLLFVVRFGLMMADSALMQKKALKITPHVVDTFLLLSGVALVMYTGFTPFTAGAGWLNEKLTCVLAYIALGFFALKYGKNKVFKTFAFLGALGWLAMAGKLAVTKMPLLG